MILLTNNQDKTSRDFYIKNKKEFDKVITYPKCLEQYGNIARFPAVVHTVPEHKKNDSVWFMLKSKYPNYKNIAFDLKEVTESITRNTCGDGGVPKFKKIIEDRGIGDGDVRYAVHGFNNFLFPPGHIWWALQFAFKTSRECYPIDGVDDTSDLKEENKKRSIKNNTTTMDIPVTEIIVPAHDEMMFPTTMEEVIAWKEGIDDKIRRINEINLEMRL